MLKIMICEADKNYEAELKQMLEKCLFDKVEVIIECCRNEFGIIEKLHQCGEISADLIFLDIQMSGMNGIEIARILRENRVSADIILMADHSEYVFQGYEMRVYDYLLKPITVKMLESVLNRYLEEKMKNPNDYLFVSKRSRKMRIPLRHVRYFISEKRKIKAILDKDYGEIDFYMKLEELEEKLQGREFIRCHQSYLVNIHKVLYWERLYIVLLGNERIPISRKYIETVNEFLDWDRSSLFKERG